MTNNPELLIIGINLSIILIAYFVIYPRFVGSNTGKLAVNDLLASAVSLLVSGYIFWGSGVKFNALLFDANWLGFSLLTYLLIELPFAVWYMKKYDVPPLP